MSLTQDFILTPQDFASRYVVLVQESGDTTRNVKCTKVTPVQVGTALQYPAGNMIFTFSIARVGTQSTGQLAYNAVQLILGDLPVHNAGQAPRAYLLPWRENNLTSMRLGNAADFFFTSTLCGCTVRVDGPRTSPRVIHANAKTSYIDTYNNSRKICTLNDPAQAFAWSESRANAVAQNEMNGKLPAANGAVGTVTKADYLSKYTAHNRDVARQRFLTPGNYKVDKFKMATGEGGLKPLIGAFVFGKKNARDEWSFYYQANIDVSGRLKQGMFNKRQMYYESIVLGPAERFYP